MANTITQEHLQELFDARAKAEAETSRLHHHKDSSVDGSIAYHRAWKKYEASVFLYNQALNDFVQANP